MIIAKTIAPEKDLKGEAKERYEALKQQLGEFDHLKPASLPTAAAQKFS